MSSWDVRLREPLEGDHVSVSHVRRDRVLQRPDRRGLLESAGHVCSENTCAPSGKPTMRTMTQAMTDGRQSLQSLERGMAVIQIFSRQYPALTLSDVARHTGLTRATARRILLTLEDLAEQTRESCSAATLDLPDIVYVARVPTRRIMTISLGVGSRLPAHSTSVGRGAGADLPTPRLRRPPARN